MAPTDEIESSLGGLTLKQADEELDLARRLLWAAHFSGKPTRLPASPRTGAMIARALEGLTLAEVAEVLELTRMNIWLDAFPNTTPQIFNIAGVGGPAN